MFEPRTLPIDRSGDSLIIESIETSSSGSDVPKPTITSPIKKSETLNLFPIAMELDNRRSAPLTNKRRPNINVRNFVITI